MPEQRRAPASPAQSISCDIVRSFAPYFGAFQQIVAATADTSISMLERTYSAYITDFADDVARRGLLAPPAIDADPKVVALTGRRP